MPWLGDVSLVQELGENEVGGTQLDVPRLGDVSLVQELGENEVGGTQLDVPWLGDGGDIARCHQHASQQLAVRTIAPRALSALQQRPETRSQSAPQPTTTLSDIHVITQSDVLPLPPPSD